MSEQKQTSGNVLVELLIRRDKIFLMEGYLGGVAFNIAWRILDPNSTGKTLPLFLNSSWSYLAWSKFAWAMVLLVMGTVKWLAAAHGLRYNNFFLVRSYVAFAASGVWSIVAVATWESHNPVSAAASYVWVWFASVMTFVALQGNARAAKRQAPLDREIAQHSETVRATGSERERCGT